MGRLNRTQNVPQRVLDTNCTYQYVLSCPVTVHSFVVVEYIDVIQAGKELSVCVYMEKKDEREEREKEREGD